MKSTSAEPRVQVGSFAVSSDWARVANIRVCVLGKSRPFCCFQFKCGSTLSTALVLSKELDKVLVAALVNLELGG